MTLALEPGFSHEPFFLRSSTARGHLQKTAFGVCFLLSPTRSPTAANARGQKCFGGRKTKAGSGGGLTVRVSAEKGGTHFNLFLFFQTSRSRQPSQGRPGRCPRSIWRWPPGQEKAGARASLVRRKQLTRRFAQQSRPSLCKASFDLALKVGGLGSSAALRDPPRAVGSAPWQGRFLRPALHAPSQVGYRNKVCPGASAQHCCLRFFLQPRGLGSSRRAVVGDASGWVALAWSVRTAAM